MVVSLYATLFYVMRMSSHLLDPDGNSVELQADNFGECREAPRWMRSASEFAADPTGRHVDPHALIAAWRAGGGADEAARACVRGPVRTGRADRRAAAHVSEPSVDVVIAGFGLVGASLALECGRRGVRCLVVDPRAEVADLLKHPRCKLVNVRSMAHMRRWGIVEGSSAATSVTSPAKTMQGPYGAKPSSALPIVHWEALRWRSRADRSLNTMYPAMASIASAGEACLTWRPITTASSPS